MEQVNSAEQQSGVVESKVDWLVTSAENPADFGEWVWLKDYDGLGLGHDIGVRLELQITGDEARDEVQEKLDSGRYDYKFSEADSGLEWMILVFSLDGSQLGEIPDGGLPVYLGEVGYYSYDSDGELTVGIRDRLGARVEGRSVEVYDERPRVGNSELVVETRVATYHWIGRQDADFLVRVGSGSGEAWFKVPALEEETVQ